MPSKSSSSRTRSRRPEKSSVPSIVIVALALLIFIATVGIAVSLLHREKPDGSSSSDPPQSVSGDEGGSSSEQEEEVLPVDPEGEGESENGGSSSSDAASGDSSPSESSSDSGSSAPAEAKFDPSTMGDSGQSNIKAYKGINSDVMGWLKIPNTNINYPVLYHSDIYYYLTRDIYKKESKNACIYADPTAKFGARSQLSRNTILYGHNWTNYSANPRIGDPNDVFFGQLTAFHHLDFAKTTPYIYFSTESEEMTWVIFAAFYTDTGFIYNVGNPDDATFASIVSGALQRSRHNYGVEVTYGDKILTLSTCTRAYGQSDQQRFVVMARLLREGETVKDISITANPNPVLPKL